MNNFTPNHTHLFIATHNMCDTKFLQQANDTHRTTRAQICSEWCFACSCYTTLSQCITGQFKYLHHIYYKSQRIEIQWLNSYQGSWYYCGEECQQVTQTKQPLYTISQHKYVNCEVMWIHGIKMMDYPVQNWAWIIHRNVEDQLSDTRLFLARYLMMQSTATIIQCWWRMNEWSMGHWWKNTDRGKMKYFGRNLSQCYYAHHKSHIYWPGIEPKHLQ